MSTIFELTAIEHCFMTGAPRAYPVPLGPRRLGLFTSRVQAERFLRETALTGQDPALDLAALIFLVLEALSLDGPLARFTRRTYLSDGRLHGEEPLFGAQKPPTFQGRPVESLRYQIGALVQFVPAYAPAHLHLGIVTAVPFSPAKVSARQQLNPAFQLDQGDDVYTLGYFQEGQREHDHPHASRLFPPGFPIEASQRKALMGFLSGESRR